MASVSWRNWRYLSRNIRTAVVTGSVRRQVVHIDVPSRHVLGAKLEADPTLPKEKTLFNLTNIDKF